MITKVTWLQDEHQLEQGVPGAYLWRCHQCISSTEDDKGVVRHLFLP
jgi:hypothetical protein